jgi:hypothetical protein
MAKAPPGYKTLQEAAEHTGYSAVYIRELAAKGKIKHLQRAPRSPIFFLSEDLDEFLGIKRPA